MNRKSALFVIPLALFACWLAYLGWLVLNRPLQKPGYPLVLSRPQVMTSEVDVIAELTDNSGKATVVEVLYQKEGTKSLKAGDVIQIEYVSECRPVVRVKGAEPPSDWDGSGHYLVPMRPVPNGKEGHYEVAPVPVSPGFAPGGLVPPVRLYRDSAEVRAQYARILKAE